MKILRKDFRLKFSVFAVLGTMGLFTLARVALWALNQDFFASLTGAEVFSAFVNGLRFDFSMVALFMGSILLLLNLPIRSRIWPTVWLSALLTEFIVMAGFLVGDLIYFPKVNRHIAEEIVQLSNDWGFIVSYAFTQTLLPLLLLLVALVMGVWFIARYTRLHYKAVQRSTFRTVEILVLIVLVVTLGIRGHLGRGKSLGVANVYNYASTPAGAALTLNGIFTAYQVGRKGSMESENTFPTDQAIQNAQALLLADTEKVLDENFPLMRQSTQETTPKDVNVMIVLLEGWHPYYIDGLSHHNFGVTPVFDEILKEGVTFTNAYATGLRSIFGFAAVFAGVPLVPGLPMFGYGLELSAFSPMPKHFADAGYYTFFAQTSHRDSYRLCALASYLGAQESYGWEDIPERLPYQAKAPFGYDYDALMFAADKIKNRKEKNFLGMVFTGITHEPFTSTLPQFDKYPYDSWEHGFLNTLSFADWSLGELLKRAKEDGWFDNTIFVFVADHTSGGPADGSLKNHFNIPLVVYAPKLLQPRTVRYVVSQLDIIPTLYQLVGLTPAYTSFGRDLFDEKSGRVALVSEGVNLGLITEKGALRHSGNKILDTVEYAPGFEVQKAEETLLSLDKAARTLLKENRWYNPAQEERK